MRPELILNIEKRPSGYRWVLFHEDGFMSIDQGTKPSIEGALRAAFTHLAVGEDVDVRLTMTPTEDFEYDLADMPRPKSGGGRMVKGASESPDFEKGAKFLIANLR